MKHKFIALLVACAAWLFVTASPVSAQATPSKCVSLITKRLEAVGTADFDFNKARQIIKEFDFGKASEFVNDGGKRLAFQKVFTSMSEFIDLAPNAISGKAMKGYTRFSGGIIRSNGADFVADLKKVFGGSTFDGPGFNKVMEQLEGTGTWLGQGRWQSKGGLVYEPMVGDQGHRISHIFDHTVPNPQKPSHSIFSDTRDKILDLVDEGFSKAKQHPQDAFRFEAEMGKVVGSAGETKMRIIVNPQTKQITTAFPILNGDVTVPGV